MANKIKVMIVDDTLTYRHILRKVLSSIENIEILGSANDGEIALSKIGRLMPDLVLLDVEMPKMNGLETLKIIRKEFPSIQVIMVSAASQHSANITIQCLEAGARDFIEKPAGLGMDKSLEMLHSKIAPLLKVFHLGSRFSNSIQIEKPIKVETTRNFKAQQRISKLPEHFDIVAIGVSTGGPEALIKLLPKFPANFSKPIVIVQHMPPVFTASLARNLNKKSQLEVHEASEGETILPGHIYIAKGGVHMILRKHGTQVKIGFVDSPPVKSCKPAVDVLFRSVANIYPGKVLCAILTGMGDDGLDGVRTLKRKGCFTITQNKESCVVYGMPRSIDEANLSDISLDISKIAVEITNKINKSKKVA